MFRSDMFHEVVNPAGLTEADLAVAVISREDAAHIALPTMKTALGLARFYPDLKSVVLNCDNSSRDGTREAFFAAEVASPRIYAASPPDLPGRGANIRNALALAAGLRVKALAIIDANLLSIKTSWIKSLFDPILNQGAEYVAPLYVRHKNENPISRWLAYPLLRAVLGRRVLQPVEVDHAFSSRLIDIYNDADFEPEDAGHRADLRFLALAVKHQARICQSFMAHPRIAARGEAADDPPRAFVQAVRALFALLAETRDFWPGVSRSRPTALAGVDEEIKIPPPQIEMDSARLAARFVELGREHQSAWARCLSPQLAGGLARELAAAARGEAPRVTIDLWRASLYEASAVYGKSAAAGAEITAALAPVFLGRCLMALETDQGLTARQLNAQAEEMALNFERAKADLVALWRA